MQSQINPQKASISHGNLEISDLENSLTFLAREEKECFVQLIPSKFVISEEQLLIALDHSLTGFETNSNFTKSQGLELILRLSAQRQLDKALKLFGLYKGRINAFLVLYGSDKARKKLLKKIKINFNFKPKKFQQPSKIRFKEFLNAYGIEIQNNKNEIQNNKNKKLISKLSFVQLEKLIIEKIALLEFQFWV